MKLQFGRAAMCCASAVIVMGGGIGEAVHAGAVGFLVSLLSFLPNPVMRPLSGLLAVLIAFALGQVSFPSSTGVSALAGLAGLTPGLALVLVFNALFAGEHDVAFSRFKVAVLDALRLAAGASAGFVALSLLTGTSVASVMAPTMTWSLGSFLSTHPAVSRLVPALPVSLVELGLTCAYTAGLLATRGVPASKWGVTVTASAAGRLAILLSALLVGAVPPLAQKVVRAMAGAAAALKVEELVDGGVRGNEAMTFLFPGGALTRALVSLLLKDVHGAVEGVTAALTVAAAIGLFAASPAKEKKD